MTEYRQPKNTLKKQVSILLPMEIYEGAKRDAKTYNRSMAYHIVETLRLTFADAIDEVKAEKEQAAKVNVLERLKTQARVENIREAEVESRSISDLDVRRMIDASEIAYLVTFLASNKAAAITGESIAAGGGVGASVFH